MTELLHAVPVLGVDPGVRGGLAVLREDGSLAHTAPLRPDMTERDLLSIADTALGVLWHFDCGGPCYFEKVGYIRGDGGKGAFTFGRVVGLLSGILLARGVPLIYVSPMVWQAHMGCLTGGDKNVSKRRAQEFFPSIKMTHAIADACLIARYGWEREAL